MPDSAARSAFPWILKYYMERDDLTQVDIANRLKVSKQTVSDWVSGKKFPRVDRMQQLADLFGVLMSEMYTPTERPSQEIKAKASGPIQQLISDINSYYDDAIIKYYSPDYAQNLLNKIDNYSSLGDIK